MTIASNHQFPRHAHDQFGIGVIRSGAQRSWSGIGQVEAGPGDVIMVNPGEMHDGVPIDRQTREWRMIYFNPELLANELDGEATGSFEVVTPVARDLPLARHFEYLFASLTNPYEDSLAREVKLLQSLIYTMRRHGMPRLPRNGRPPCVSRALKQMDTAPEIPVSLKELAALTGVSRFQFLRAFAAATGTTPHAYLIQRRVQLAKQLLAQGHAPVSASMEAGFADQSHMSRAFVRQLGITPSRYQAAVS